ncbi:MAG: hypothetical protein IPN79_10750 [Saprospiraceae bacterium]|nr:hypothetical protein [Saprospiraceae bacterium]
MKFLIGVNVVEKGTSNGTITDIDGKLNWLLRLKMLLWSFLISDIRTQNGWLITRQSV